MSRVLVFGGHGKVAMLLHPMLAARGDQVSAVIRDAGQAADVESAGATPLVADVEHLDTGAIAALIHGHDAVVWSAGAGGGNPARTYGLDRDAAIRSMDAASAAWVRRYVMVSYFGAGPDHGVAQSDPFFAYADAKSAADAHLRAGGLDWTIVAPSTLTLDEPSGRIDAAASAAGTVSRGDVAAVVAAVLADPATAGRTIRFNSGDTPVAEALGHS